MYGIVYIYQDMLIIYIYQMYCTTRLEFLFLFLKDFLGSDCNKM